ncbi:septum formation protein Maf [Verrucomicrobiaceae bacterium 5K15]|uniref:dTTP/UTP pyrophosphatase n=1 Tax=Oceaniferula flava TaxID=2800421 RepID=A0AAE2SC31_9BACT|nr:Maf family protein [Oceaniferula flavus]MBK1854282.1 septum formation protein Maf [Oceaniferula flavus]MBM1135588.1 septum formation protein Maf [Oceaniferula flavus]
MAQIILASGSPRRREMLAEAGLDFDVIPSPAEEIHDVDMPLHLLCEENARLKAVEVAKDHPEAAVIGADTLVYIDQTPLGKPKSEQEARETLAKLSGRAHQVCTGVCIAQGETTNSFHCITEVVFKTLTPELIQDYMTKVNVMDKAGSYAVQEHGEMIIDEVRGDYDNVVGLPITQLLEKLAEA